jgi:hypothetical protein
MGRPLEDNIDIESLMLFESVTPEEGHYEDDDLESLMESVDLILESDDIDEHDDDIYANEDMDEDLLMDDDEEEDLLDEGNAELDPEEEIAKSNGNSRELKDLREDVDFNVNLFDPIAFSEDHVRIHSRGDHYLISESDFEAVCFNYLGEKNGYQVLETIAESHGIDVDNLVVFLAEGETSNPNVSVKKGKSNKGGNSIKQRIQALTKQIASLPPNSPAAKARREERKKLRAQLTLRGE